MQGSTKGNTSILQQVIRILFRLTVVIATLLFVLVLIIAIPAVQTFIAQRIINSIQSKTGTEISLQSVKIGLPNTVKINQLYLSDKNADTLLYLRALNMDVSLLSLLKNEILVNDLTIENLVSHIHRKTSESDFNFQFLADAFQSDTDVKPKNKGKPWLIQINSISLNDIYTTYYDARNGTDLFVDLGRLNVLIKNIDPGKPEIDLAKILLSNTTVKLGTASVNAGLDNPGDDATQPETKAISGVNEAAGVFLSLNIKADQLQIENTNFSLDNQSSPLQPEGIDYQHLDISQLNASLSSIAIDSAGYRAKFDALSFAERCGITIKNLATAAEFTDRHASLKNLVLETSASSISGNLTLDYYSFKGFLDDLWNTEVFLNLEKSSINVNEVFLFVPSLSENSYLNKFKGTDIQLNTQAQGRINDLIFNTLELSCMGHSYLKSNFRITGVPDINSMALDARIDRFASSLSDIYKFVPPAKLAGYKLPPTFAIKAKLKGKIHSFMAGIDLSSPYGKLIADGFYKAGAGSRRDTFAIDFKAQNILAGTILADTMIGKTSCAGTASGSGLSSKQISMQTELQISEAEYNKYNYNNLLISGIFSENQLSATASSSDTNITFNLSVDADLRDSIKNYSAILDLNKANLHALNFTSNHFSVTTQLNSKVNYKNPQNANAILVLNNFQLSGEEKSLPVKSLEITAFTESDSTAFIIKSDVFDGTAHGNIPLLKLSNTIKSAFNRYFGIPDTIRQAPGNHFAFNLDFHIKDDILKMFSPDFKALIINKLDGNYCTDNNRLNVDFELPLAQYSGLKVDLLNLKVNGENNKLNMALSANQLSYDTLQIKNIRINEQVENGIIHSEISTIDTSGKPSYRFLNKLEAGTGLFRVSFLQNGLLMNDTLWQVPENNLVEKREGKLEARNFIFSNGKQSIGFVTDDVNQNLSFKNFEIANLLNIIQQTGEKKLLGGNLNGELGFPSTGKQKYMNVNLGIKDIHFQDSLIGDLSLKMKTENNKMEIESWLESFQNKITLSGTMDLFSHTPQLNLNSRIEINNLTHFERFTFGKLSELSGQINSNIFITGTAQNPVFNGNICFNKTIFKINSLNFLAKIEKDTIQIDPEGVHFSNFEIADFNSKKLTLNGDILTNDLTNPTINLNLKTNDLQAINSTVTNNPLFYGNLFLDAQVDFKGTIRNPGINAEVKINKATDLTYVLPGSELQLVTSQGVVEFVDPEKSADSILTVPADYLTDSIISKLKGFELALNLKTDPEAKFKVDIDPKSGDFLIVSGASDLNIKVDAEGKQSITGRYEVKNGVYQLSFYGLVKKTFTIAPGSSVAWSGKPMDADLDITAEYEVRTSSVSLVANETAEMSDAEKQTFNKRLPYMVKLNINGFLSEPEIGFRIDLPEKYMLTYPLVATKLTALNSEENKAELNKQVFALLVTGSFMADNPMNSNSSSPTNIATTAARNSVNGILADQLNNISNKYISKVDVNFGLTSYEDYEDGSGDVRTEMDIQVSKKLFHDRLTVEAMGSFDLDSSKNPTTSTSKKMTNEFAVIYQLTENGEYKLRAYYEDAYDLFDGDISYSGIALIFEKEFETLKRKKKEKND